MFDLARIESMNLIESGQLDLYYDLVTDTLRTYLGARYNFPAIDMTTDEMVSALGGQLRKLDLKDSVVVMLRESDLVKFAKSAPDAARARDLIEESRRIVRETAPTEVYTTTLENPK